MRGEPPFTCEILRSPSRPQEAHLYTSMPRSLGLIRRICTPPAIRRKLLMDFDAVQEWLGAFSRLGWSGSNQAVHSIGRCRSGEARTRTVPNAGRRGERTRSHVDLGFSKKQGFGSSVRNRLIEKPAEGVDHNTACFPPGGRGSETTFSTRRGRKHRVPGRLARHLRGRYGRCCTADTHSDLVGRPRARAPLADATGVGLDIGSTF